MLVRGSMSTPVSPSLHPRKKARTVTLPKIVHGDCINGMKVMSDSSVRLVLADPRKSHHA
jgi:predicted methyltransferase